MRWDATYNDNGPYAVSGEGQAHGRLVLGALPAEAPLAESRALLLVRHGLSNILAGRGGHGQLVHCGLRVIPGQTDQLFFLPHSGNRLDFGFQGDSPGVERERPERPVPAQGGNAGIDLVPGETGELSRGDILGNGQTAFIRLSRQTITDGEHVAVVQPLGTFFSAGEGTTTISVPSLESYSLNSI